MQHQVRCSGNLIDDGYFGRFEQSTVGVVRSSKVQDRLQPRRTERDVGHAATPHSPKGVGDDDGDVNARALAQSGANAAAPNDRDLSGSNTAVPSSAFERSTPAFALMKPWRVSVIRKRSTSTKDAGRFAFYDRDLVLVGAVIVDDLSFRLRDDFARDDDEVVVAKLLARVVSDFEQERDEIVVPPDLDARGKGDDAQIVTTRPLWRVDARSRGLP